jgi:hypothetical protein
LSRMFSTCLHPYYPVKAKALEMADKFRRAGLTVWIDTDHLADSAAVMSITESLETAINSSRVVAVCICEDYEVSWRCKQEALFAVQNDKPFVVINVGADGYVFSCNADGWPKEFTDRARDKLFADCRSHVSASDNGWSTAVRAVLNVPGVRPVGAPATQTGEAACWSRFLAWRAAAKVGHTT